MEENNKSYRIRTKVGSEAPSNINLDINLLQDYDTFDILSLKIDTDSLYKLHTSKYGCLVGRVLANGGVGVPNVKISVFIPISDEDKQDSILNYMYPYQSPYAQNSNSIRYNLLPEDKVTDCHQAIGSFPSKRTVLDDDNVSEVFNGYYKFTTTTNESGDYMIFGLPVGDNKIHSDLDLSDIGILSQKPRDLYYKGYNPKLFENASKFKKDTNIDNLVQVISSDSSVYVYPFWGDETENPEQIKITRYDINVNYKFEPTCIFIGCIVSDEKSNALSKNCIPHERMGKMDRLTTGKGTIEMIRKTPEGTIESFSIQGNDLIDGNGTWCYQIPMNLDYVTTNEYGKLVKTENTENGIPTRAEVRFRISLADYESDYATSHLVKILVPNTGDDYEFGSKTSENSFKTLFYNNVYTVKSYIPRYQKGYRYDRNKNFTGFKAVNINSGKNPIPYNNFRINLNFLFVFQCLIFKCVIMIVKFLNKLLRVFNRFTSAFIYNKKNNKLTGPSLSYITIDGGMCPFLEGNYIAPGAKPGTGGEGPDHDIVANTYINLIGEENWRGNTIQQTEEGDSGRTTATVTGTTGTTISTDTKSSDFKNTYSDTGDTSGKTYYLSNGYGTSYNEDIHTFERRVYGTEDYFVKCVELEFAMEYEVINFDFYNDWINGMIYIPRWFAEVKKNKDRLVYCYENSSNDGGAPRYIVQQCAIPYNSELKIKSDSNFGCNNSNVGSTKSQECGRSVNGRKYYEVSKNNGLIKRNKTLKNEYVYYPITHLNEAIAFSNDIVLLGSLDECNKNGLPTALGYPSSTYIMPPTLGMIISESQTITLNKGDDRISKYEIYTFEKQTGVTTDDEKIILEVSGIDWGYNPFKANTSDDTTQVKNQVAGHFLEIGCTFSLSNLKSCVNLQRICELGAEPSQSHHYSSNDTKTYNYIHASGIIGNREIIDKDIRSKFALLNSNNLTTISDNDGFLKYNITNYVPNSFLGELSSRNEINNLKNDTNYAVVEYTTESYKQFRFGGEKVTLLSIDNTNYMPQFRNSFYFYFGIKDGDTAIDRLYNEYFAKCDD